MKLKTPAVLTRSPQHLVLFLIGLIILWIVASAVYAFISDRMIGTMVIESETTDIVFSSYGFIQKEESVIKSDVSGKVKHNKEQSDRVAKNHVVFYTTYTNEHKEGIEKPFYAPASGIVNFNVDGYETFSDSDRIRNLDLKGMYEKEKGKNNNRQVTQAESGQAIATIIDNLQPIRFYFSYNPSNNSIFSEVGDVFQIQFPDFNEKATAEVVHISSYANGQKFCEATLSPMSDAFSLSRVAAAEIYRSEAAKLYLPLDRVVYYNGTPGVYVIEHQTVNWKPVKVLEDTDQQLICEILPKGTIIVTTPSRVEPGDIVNRG